MADKRQQAEIKSLEKQIKLEKREHIRAALEKKLDALKSVEGGGQETKDGKTASRRRSDRSQNILVFFVLLAALLFLPYLLRNTARETAGTKPAGVEYSYLSYTDIRNNMDSQTEAKFDIYRKSVIGKWVVWVGWVDDVEKKRPQEYKVLIDMDPPDTPISVQDVTFVLPEDAAMRLSKGQKIQFSGRVASVTPVFRTCQITLDSARVEAY